MENRTTRIRNQFPGRIAEIVRGPVCCEVDIVTAAGIFTSTIETQILDQLGLKTGSPVVAIVRSQDVRLAPT
jgi:molybdopterin-binding protein